MRACLVAAWGFDEGVGAIAGDRTGNGNGGTISNALWLAGKVGNALSFNGSNAWVTVADSATLHLTRGMTLEAWVSPSSLGARRNILLKQRGSPFSYALYGTSPDHSPSTPSVFVNTGSADKSLWARGPSRSRRGRA